MTSVEETTLQAQSEIQILLERAVATLNGRCRMHFTNSTPSGWEITITEVGCKFFYQDADGKITDDEMQFAKVSLKSGDSHELLSGKPNGCVAQVYAVVKATWTENGRRKEQVFEDHHGIDPESCLRYCPFELVPEFSTSRAVQDLLPLQLEYSGK